MRTFGRAAMVVLVLASGACAKSTATKVESSPSVMPHESAMPSMTTEPAMHEKMGTPTPVMHDKMKP